jgi:hypothetical protein
MRAADLHEPPMMNRIVNLRLGLDLIVKVMCAIVNTAKVSPAMMAGATAGT